MKHIAFDPRFVNAAGNDLIPGKIHTIRQNFFYWKRFEGREVALFTWEGKPYQKGSKHKVFCVKRIVSVQKVLYSGSLFYRKRWDNLPTLKIVENDGFKDWRDFQKWFANYKPGKMAIIHFTNYRYGL